MTGLNSNTNRVYYLLQMKVKCDIEEAKSWIKNRSAKVTFELSEDKTISFEWFMSEDGNEATIVETFVDSDGAKERVENLLASPISSEWSERFEPTNWVVFGNVKKDLIDLLGPMGAKFQGYVGGFNHN